MLTRSIFGQKRFLRTGRRWQLPSGFEGFIEEIALKCFMDRGWQGLWGENSLWEFLMALLFWDVFFAKIEGAWHPSFVPGSPTCEQDMPFDWGKAEFQLWRQELISRRLEELGKADLDRELTQLHASHYGGRCRPIWDWERFSLQQLIAAAGSLPRSVLLMVTQRIVLNYSQYRCGLPDLLIWKQDDIAFAEIKGPRDKLSEQQIEWLVWLRQEQMRAFVVARLV